MTTSSDHLAEDEPTRRRTLSDSQARWEAVNLIAAAAEDFVAGGAVPARGTEEGWTMADMLAVEQHVHDRVDGLIRRPRSAPLDERDTDQPRTFRPKAAE